MQLLARISVTMPDRVLPSPTIESPLLAWLLAALAPMSRTRVKELLSRGQIQINGSSVTKFDLPVRPGDRVVITTTGQPTKRDPQDGIVYQDEALLILDKPAGLLSVATNKEKLDTAFVRLSAHLEDRNAGRPYVVHRLDRDTSGLLLFARSPELRDALQARWETAEKTYLAVVEGTPRDTEGVIHNFLREGKNLKVRAVAHGGGDAKLAVTHYRVLRSHRGLSLVEVKLETGRKHQIRVHFADLGCPVIGDRIYGAKGDPADRLGLHAWRLAFDHPLTGKRLEVKSELPAALKRLVAG